MQVTVFTMEIYVQKQQTKTEAWARVWNQKINANNNY